MKYKSLPSYHFIYVILDILFSFGILVWDEGTASVNNPLRYNELRNRVGYDEYIAHFPQMLSKNVLENQIVI